MSEFLTYLELGLRHISDPSGFDHMLFIVTLAAVYSYKDWKSVIWLVTAFTIGHSITLAMVALDYITVNPTVVEFLIPVTIFLTAISNLLFIDSKKIAGRANYILAVGFGFIHGMGFSNFFKALGLSDAGIISELFAFNVGLEIGQIFVVIAFFLIYFLIDKIRNFSHRSWTIFFSGVGAGLSFIMILEALGVIN